MLTRLSDVDHEMDVVDLLNYADQSILHYQVPRNFLPAPLLNLDHTPFLLDIPRGMGQEESTLAFEALPVPIPGPVLPELSLQQANRQDNKTSTL